MRTPSEASYYRHFLALGPKSLVTFMGHSRELVRGLTMVALEAGLSHSEATKLALGVFQEIMVLARDERGHLLGNECLWDVYEFSVGVLRSGSTFSSFEIVTRALGAQRGIEQGVRGLLEKWDPEKVDARMAGQVVRRKAAALIDRQNGHVLWTGTTMGPEAQGTKGGSQT